MGFELETREVMKGGAMFDEKETVSPISVLNYINNAIAVHELSYLSCAILSYF